MLLLVLLIERNGKVRAKHILTVNRTTLTPFIKQNVAPGTRVITDEHHGYADLNKNNYQHDFVKHTEKIYVIGDFHTNTIENFWSVVKRCIHGTYHQLSAKHLQVYINEISFRFNTRNETEEARFDQALNKCHGRLKYNNLICKVENK